ncbi:MAG: hypothetical protein RLZZ127_462 [Planctomycetota bacterium]|jgi:hypothetical protein
MMLRAFLPCLLAAVATSADPASTTAPVAVTILDSSRSSSAPAVADRIRFIAGTLIPLLGPSATTTWEAGRGAAPVTDVRSLNFGTRWSDYPAALDLAGNRLSPGPAVFTIAGDGLVEAVHEGMPAAYLAGLPADATRDQINAQATRRLDTLIDGLARRPATGWLLLDTLARSDPSSVHAMVKARRPDTPVLALPDLRLAHLLQAAVRAGLRMPGNGYIDGVLSPDQPSIDVRLPEGCEGVILLLNAVAGDGGWSIVAQEPQAGWTLTALDGDGAARAYRLSGCQAGGILRLLLKDSVAGVEMVALHRTRIVHRMEAVPRPGTDFLYAGDPATIRHRFTRGPGSTPVSAALEATLLRDMVVGGAASRLPRVDALKLPPQAGSGILSATFAAPWNAWVDSQPLTVSWTMASPLVLAGGFESPIVHDGKPIEVRFVQQGGRRRILATSATLSDGVRHRIIDLAQPVDGAPGTLVGQVSFTPEERTSWRFSDRDPVAGDDETGLLAAAPPRSLVVDVRKDWMPLILLASALLLLLLSALIWWLLTRPRFRDEVFIGTDGARLLRGSLVGRRRDLSSGHPSFSGVEFRATRGAVRIERIAAGTVVWVNARMAGAGDEIPAGSDVEVRGARQGHARFFTAASQAAGWGADKALIDAEHGLGQVHVVIDVS